MVENNINDQTEPSQIDDEVTNIMGLPPEEAAPRMSSDTPNPVVVNNPATMTEQPTGNVQPQKSFWQKLFGGRRHDN